MKMPLRVLVVEDSFDDTFILVRALERANFETTHLQVSSRAEMETALREQYWDLVISDHSLPGFGSFEALRLVKEIRPDLPFIVVSGVIGEEIAVAVMKAGANDYVMKSNLARLAPSIERELREAESRRARKRAEEALQRSQQELEDFFEHAAVGLRRVGPGGLILRVNKAELEMLGYQREEYLGHNIAEFLVDDGAAAELKRRLKCGETLTNYELRMRAKDGSIRHVMLNANA